jgi:hypothetical protein
LPAKHTESIAINKKNVIALIVCFCAPSANVKIAQKSLAPIIDFVRKGDEHAAKTI